MAVTPFPIGIPADVNLDDVRSRAKALLKSVQAGEGRAQDRIEPYFADPSSLTLQRAQLVIAREHGFSSWRKLKAFVDARDELADYQRKLAGMPISKQRPGNLHERQRLARELRRLMRVTAVILDVTVDDTDTACCTFCFQPQNKVDKLIAGTSGFICDQCVDRCASLMEESPVTTALDDGNSLPCSFCQKAATQVNKVIAASNSIICNECLKICLEIVGIARPKILDS